MDFGDLPDRPRRRIRLVDHAMILAAVGWTLFLFRNAVDFDRGPAELGDCFAFTMGFVALAYFLGWEPNPGWAWVQTPLFFGLTLVYLWLAIRAGYVQPGATGWSILAQMTVLTALLMRTS